MKKHFLPGFAVPMIVFWSAEILILIIGSGASAYLLARSRKEPSHSANIPAYLMAFIVTNGVICVRILLSL